MLKTKEDLNTNLIFNKKIDEDSAQGSCGILTLNNNTEPSLEINEEPKDCRDLISNYITNSVFYKYGNNGHNCTLARQEYIISQSLMNNCAHLPNFLRSIIYMKNHLIRNDKCIDPFDVKNTQNKNKVSCSDLVIFEFIENKISFYKFLKKKNLSSEFINSMLMQIFLAVLCAQQSIEFVHNDLHSNNILILKCDKNLKILYRIQILNKTRYFLVPTYGYYPVIIDYGYSYTKDCENMSLECLDLDNFGLITYQYDSLSDFIRLSAVLAGRNINKRLTEKIKEMFKNLPVSMENSWEKIVEKDTLWYIEKIFFKTYGKERYSLQKKYIDQLLRLYLRKILLPVKYNEEFNKVDIHKELILFMEEWSSIDKWFKYNYEKTIIFRELIDASRKYGDDTEKISAEVSKMIHAISSKIIPLDVKWNILNSSLRNSTGFFENLIYKKIKELNRKRREKLYSSLISSENIFMNYLPFIYEKGNKELNEEDLVLLIDNIERSNMIIKISEKKTLQEKDIYNFFS